MAWSIALLLLAGPASAQAGTQSPVAADVGGAEVLVVGVPGLRWDDVDPRATPALHRLADSSAVGALSVKAVPAVSCAADGWLTLGAGSRAQAFDVACGDLPAAGPAELERQRRRNDDTPDRADPTALADALEAAGGCLAARGPGAELAGGRPLDGTSSSSSGSAVPGEAAPGECAVLLLDATVVGADGAARQSGASAADALVGAVDEARDPGSTLLVVGLSEAPTDDRAHLHVALAAGPDFGPGALRSPSTGRSPYVQLVDVAPTVLELVGIDPPDAMTGQPWRSVGEPPTVQQLADLDTRAVEAKRATVPFFVVLVGVLLVLLAAARARRSWRVAELAGLGTVAALGGSYLAGLVPWWRSPLPVLALLAVAGAVAVGAAALARRVPGRLGPAGAVTGGLALLLAVDLATGARLQLDTPAGYSPLVAGRFAGIGNVAFGVLAAAVLLGLAAATAGRSRRTSLAVVGAGGLLAVVLDGAPAFGRDVGGVLALLPALVLLALLRTGTRVSVTRLLLAGLAGAAVVTTFALADYSRDPPDRTHLGRFVQDVRDGTAGALLRRKAEAVLDLLFANPVTALLPLVVAAVVLLVVRPPAPLRRAFDAAPAWRHGLVAVGAASAVGFAVNDSGAAVPALAILVAAPATVAVVARTARCGAGAAPPATAARRGPLPAADR